jgi:hypothetical protein
MIRLRRRFLLGLSLGGLLAACAAPPPQALVSVFTPGIQLPPGTTYRYEQAGRPDMPLLESVADAGFARAGLQRADANARLGVQVTVSLDAVAYGPAVGPGSVGIGVGGGGWHGGGVGLGFSFPIGGAAVYPSQRVDVQLRDRASGQVVFQSQASSNTGANPAMLVEALLRDFPNAPPGTRVVPLPTPAAY